MSVTNAIQQDATNTDINNTDEGNIDNPMAVNRLSAMEAIAERNLEKMRSSGDIEGDFVPEPAEKPASDVVKNDDTPTDSDQLAAQLAQDDRPVYADPSMRVKVKVEGQEIELPLSDVVKSYQKDSAATRRLQDATELLKIAQQKANVVAQTETTPNNADTSAVDSGKEERLGAIKGAFSKLYEGDEDGAAQEMLRLLESGAQATQVPIDPSRIAAEVKETLAVESAYDNVRKDYPDLFASDARGVVLGKAAFDRMQQKELAGSSRSEALVMAVEEVAQMFGIQKAGRQTADTTSTAENVKLTKKAQLDIPVGANVVAGSKVVSVEDPNPSSTIAEMAKSRLGQSMNFR